MDINQSSLSRSKLNKPGIARSASENKAISEAMKSKDSPSAQPASGTKQAELAEGQLIKGQIIDHRYNEVKIQLEPGKQIVNAKLSGDVPLAIGQEAQFVVTEDGSDRLVLKYLPESTTPSEATIQKALTASGLPMNDRNRAIVEELLKHTMPVDKQTLQTLVRLSHINRAAAPLTLVLMYKNNIPMTTENIKQYEAYQNGTSRMLNDIHRITKGLTELIQAEGPSVIGEMPGLKQSSLSESVQVSSQPNMISNNNDILSDMPTKDINPITQALTANNELLDVLIGNHSPSAETTNPVAGDLASLITQLKQEAMSSEETVNFIRNHYPEIDRLLSEQNQTLPIIYQETQAPAMIDQLSSLLKQINGAKEVIPPLPALLNPQELDSFAELLRSIPSLSKLADGVREGSIQTKDFLKTLQQTMVQMESLGAEKLLASTEYRTLLENAFHDKWTITPEKLSEKDALRELYDNLREDMNRLSALSKLEAPLKEDIRLQEPLKNLQENLRFMQDLNEMYTYLQLPVQLKNQDVHSELFVFTRKKALQNKEALSVLLHLDMTNLGSMNIHIRMDHNNVQAKFYMDNSDAKQLISEYMPSLTETLSKKGYNLQSEVTESYEKVDFSRDFIEDAVTENDVKRYTFDIRT